jgi:hypothetical protein
MRRKLLFVVIACSVLIGTCVADEGMWLFNKPPVDKIKAKYGFTATPQWLEHVQKSSVRFNNGGSGSFVSSNGLTFTNHHVGAECVQQLSTKDKDYMKLGYYAKTQAEEAKCPDLELNVLQDIEDVTAKVDAAVKKDMTSSEAGTAKRAAMSQIENECTQQSKLRCDVVTLYSGGMYHLYKYKKYTDVRLVFAPEFQAAFFGGDPDNFEYPRYDLDITFFRIYENDKPVHLANYLRWSSTGVKDGDLIFVSGHPGRTERLLTMAQLMYLRDTRFPFVLDSFGRRIAMLKKFAAESPENARIAQEDIFGLENSYKAYKGELEGLQDKALMAKKAAEETQLRKASGNDDPWKEIAQAVDVQKRTFFSMTFVENLGGFRGMLNHFARDIVRGAGERAKPNAERLREYRESALPSMEQGLLSTAPIYKSLETLVFTDSLTEMQTRLGADNVVVKRVLNGRSPAEVVKAAIDGTKLDQVEVRKQLWEGGEAAVKASTDPLIVLMRDIEPDARAIRKEQDDQVTSVISQMGAEIAKVRFKALGTNVMPDAGFTLRLSYGAVKGYNVKGAHINWSTNMGGAFEHAAKHGNKDPYELPKSWMENKAKLNLTTPLNFVSTADIIGGNSGSPTVNKAGEVVGIIFDGNIESLPWNFVFDDRQGRAVSVDSRGIIEALRKIYKADALADELTPAGGLAHPLAKLPRPKQEKPDEVFLPKPKK